MQNFKQTEQVAVPKMGSVEREIQGVKYLWKLPDTTEGKHLELAASYALSVPLAQTLLTRGFTHKDSIEKYLFTSREQDVSHPASMKDAQKAVDRIMRAIASNEKILIIGDYDVDGITASSLMMASLLPLGAQVNFYIPHRVKEGYGLSTAVVHRAADNGYKVLITVDNGITAFDPANAAKDRGIDLIITDHHRPHNHLPDAYAIVNPHQHDCQYPFKEFAGVGVIFKVLSLLYEQCGKQLPDKAYELLLLGTVADVVPLLGENRFWVRHGLSYISKQQSLSLQVLKEYGKCLDKVLSSTDIGFKITPQINALGRLEDPRQGVSFLLGSDAQETRRIGSVLYQLNETRKDIERSIFESVEQLIQNGTIDLAKERCIFAASDNWPPGVIGLVASRLVGKYGRPTFLFHLTKAGKAKGSCRSIPACNVFLLLEKHSALLDQFGGHAMAAGLALDKNKLGDLKTAFEEELAQILTPEDLRQSLLFDAPIAMGDVTQKLLQDMQLFEPFGAQNSQPLFYMKHVSLVHPPQLLKGAHVKCMVFADGIIKPLIFFNRPELFDLLTAAQSDAFHIALQISENSWNGKTSVELYGVDVAFSKGE